MRFRVCPYQYVGEGNPDKDGGEYLGTCKQCVRLVSLVSVLELPMVIGGRKQS